MSKKLSIVILMCVAVLLPNITTAQNVFAKQKVVIADVRDVNDCKLEDNIKHMIRQNFVDACTNANDYEVYEVNLNDIKAKIKASGQQVDFTNICKAINGKADYIIFIEVMTNTSDRKSPNMKIFITSKLYRIATASMESTDMETAQPNTSSIMTSVNVLLKKSLGIESQQQVQQTHQQNYAGSNTYTQPIGFVNMNDIITAMPEFKTAQAELEAYGKTLQGRLEEIQVQFNNKLADYEKYKDTYSSDTKKRIEQELQYLQFCLYHNR